MLDKKPADPRPCIVELIVTRSPDVLRNPRVPRPINVEFRVGWIELTLDKYPALPKPPTVLWKYPVSWIAEI